MKMTNKHGVCGGCIYHWDNFNQPWCHKGTEGYCKKFDDGD